jgi:Xaa-Pro aminopeptidase
MYGWPVSRARLRLRSLLPTLILALSLSSMVACKPTVERESRTWSSNIEAVAEYGTRWPGFEAVLEASKAEAEKLMKAADEISSDEARAEAMQAANKVLSPLLGKLRSVSTKLDELDRAERRLDRLKVSPKQKREVADVREAARRVQAEVEKTMSAAAPATEAEARRILDEQIGRLTGSIKACESTFDRLSEPKGNKKQ